nr:MAG TPA: hypothetical protein [Caudoviricetes sp.]
MKSLLYLINFVKKRIFFIDIIRFMRYSLFKR